MRSLDSKKFPTIRKDWNGNSAIEFYDGNGVIHTVEMQCLVGLHSDESACQTVIHFTTGIFCTNYNYHDLRDFLYPITQEE